MSASDVGAITGQVARAEVVIASRAAGLPAPWESPSTSLTDSKLIEDTSRAARGLGFGGRLCIHPAQLAPVRAGFAPTAEEVGWAERIAGAGDAVSRVGDEMVDRPVLERARAILRRRPAEAPDQKLPRPLPIKVTPITSSRTAITVALLCTSQPRRDSKGLVSDDEASR